LNLGQNCTHIEQRRDGDFFKAVLTFSCVKVEKAEDS